MIRLFIFIALLGSLSGQTYQDYRDSLVKEEGFRTHIYTDSMGNPTIGIGHKLGRDEHFNCPISGAQVKALFVHDLSRAIEGARRAVPSFDIQPKQVKVMLVSICFNIGCKGMLSFKRFRQRIEESDYRGAARELRNSLYYRQLPRRVEGYAKVLDRS